MEHQTGPDGPARTEAAEQAGAVQAGAPESGSAGYEAEPIAGEHRPGPEDGREASAERAADREWERGGEASAERASDATGERAREPQPVATTGEPRVDAALKLLDNLRDLPVSEHSEVFEQVHAQLSDVLGELDSRPAGPAGG
jgi:hypothetical protein